MQSDARCTPSGNSGFRLAQVELSETTCALTSGAADAGVSWQNIPACEPITCEVPVRPTGEIRPVPSRTGTIGFGDRVQYTCEPGWALDDGPVLYECGTDDDFLNPPICTFYFYFLASTLCCFVFVSPIASASAVPVVPQSMRSALRRSVLC